MIKVNTLENYSQVQDKYYITTCGKVLIVKNGEYKIMKPSINKKGYHQYRLVLKDDSTKSIRPYVHKLVALAYIFKDDDKKTQVDHKDMNKEHNYITNLEWVTNLENMRRRNIIKGRVNSKLTNVDVVYIRDHYRLWREGRIWKSNAKDLAIKFNVSKRTITNAANYRSYKY